MENIYSLLRKNYIYESLPLSIFKVATGRFPGFEYFWPTQVAAVVQNPPVSAGDARGMGSPGRKNSVEEELATHSSILG